MKNSIDTCLLTTRNVSMCAPRVTRHTSIRYSSSSHTQASTWMHRYSSHLQWSVPLGYRGHVGRILCTKCTLHSNHRLTRVIFQHTKRILPHRERPRFSLHTLSTPSGTNVNYDEKWLIGGKKFLRCSFIWSGLINTCPTVLNPKFL